MNWEDLLDELSLIAEENPDNSQKARAKRLTKLLRKKIEQLEENGNAGAMPV